MTGRRSTRDARPVVESLEGRQLLGDRQVEIYPGLSFPAPVI